MLGTFVAWFLAAFSFVLNKICLPTVTNSHAVKIIKKTIQEPACVM